MKRIVPIIRQEKLEDMKNALFSIGCEGMNVNEVKRSWGDILDLTKLIDDQIIVPIWFLKHGLNLWWKNKI